MLIYSIGLILTSILMLLAQISYNKSILAISGTNISISKYRVFNVMLIILAIIPMSLISGLRYGVGTDYFYTYFPGFYYNLIGQSPYNERIFNALISFIQLFTKNSQWLFIVTSFIFNIFMILSIKNISKNYLISTIIYIFGNVFFISLNNVRQSCALAISIYAFSLLFADKKIIKYILFALFSGLAIGFHHTSFILIITILILQIPFIKKYYLQTGIIILALTPILYFVFKFVFSHTQYAWYFEPKNDKPLFAYMFPHLLSFGLMIICRKNYNSDKIFSNLFIINVIALSITVVSVFMLNNETLSRACNYFDWCIIFIIPYFLNNVRNKYFDYPIIILSIILIMICSYYTFVILGHHEVFPYRTIINPEWRWY